MNEAIYQTLDLFSGSLVSQRTKPQTLVGYGPDSLVFMINWVVRYHIRSITWYRQTWTWTLRKLRKGGGFYLGKSTTKEKQRTTHMSLQFATTITKIFANAQSYAGSDELQNGLVFNSMLAVIPFSLSWIFITDCPSTERPMWWTVSQSVINERTHSTANE